MSLKNQLVGFVIVIVSLSCFAQQTAQDSAEVLFLQARHYSMQGKDSLALKSYEAAYTKDSNCLTLKKEVVIQCIKNSQFEKAITLISNGTAKFNLITDLAQYNYGNKVAEFYCFIEDTITADSLWTSLIYNAVQSRNFDSAVVLANSFEENIPNSQTPHQVLSWLEKRGLIKSATTR